MDLSSEWIFFIPPEVANSQERVIHGALAYILTTVKAETGFTAFNVFTTGIFIANLQA